uniref:Uncharacterized protein n=1 Tax=Romanomermis culicivorax TaxID=13658 RepID=A0A915HQ51_ROMCU
MLSEGNCKFNEKFYAGWYTNREEQLIRIQFADCDVISDPATNRNFASEQQNFANEMVSQAKFSQALQNYLLKLIEHSLPRIRPHDNDCLSGVSCFISAASDVDGCSTDASSSSSSSNSLLNY